MSTKQYDITFAGNGILSYATAFALADKNPNLKIAIVGPADKAGNATLAAGAMFASFAEIEKGYLDTELDSFVFDLNRAASKMWIDWVVMMNKYAPEEMKLKINFGTYVLHNTRADEYDDANFKEIIKVLDKYKEPYEFADPEKIVGFNPQTDSRSTEVLYIPQEGSIRSLSVYNLYEYIFRSKLHVDLIEELVDKVVPGKNGNHTIETKEGNKYTSKVCVMAAGAKTQEFIDQIPELKGRVPRIVYGIGTGLLLKTPGIAPEKVIRTANRGMACGVHVVPYDKDYCYIGASNFISPWPEYNPRMTSLYSLLQGAMEQVHRLHYKSNVEKVHVGFRPTTVDTYPVIGETSLKGLWIMSGTKRIGFHMSPFYATSIANEIVGEKPLFDGRFKPERKLFHTMTKEQGILKAVAHLKSAGYQHELKMPKAGWDDMVDEMLRRKVEKIYDERGIKDFGIPPEMLDMYRYGHAQEVNP